MDELEYLKNLNLGTEEEQDPTLVAQQAIQQPEQQSMVPDLNKIEVPEVPVASPVSKELDPRLVEALKQRSDTRQSADLLRSFQQLIQAGATGTGYKSDMSMADSIERRANDPVDIYKLQSQQEIAAAKAQQDAEKNKMFIEAAKMKLKEADIKMKDTELGKDATSGISKVTQELAKMYFKMTGQPYNEKTIDNTPGNDLIKLLPSIQKAGTEYFRDKQLGDRMEESKRQFEERQRQTDEYQELKKDEIKRREEQDTVREKQKQIDTARGFIKDDPRFKKAMEQTMEFDSVNELLVEASKGNQQAVGAIGTKLARAMGEVGVLTDSDVVRYVAGQSWGRQLLDWFKKGSQGELSKETIAGIKSNLKILKEKLDADVNKIHTLAFSRMKSAYPDADDDFIRGVLGMPGSVGKTKSSSNMVQMIDPNGKPRLVPKDKVEAAKAAGGKVVE